MPFDISSPIQHTIKIFNQDVVVKVRPNALTKDIYERLKHLQTEAIQALRSDSGNEQEEAKTAKQIDFLTITQAAFNAEYLQTTLVGWDITESGVEIPIDENLPSRLQPHILAAIQQEVQKFLSNPIQPATNAGG